ncbi:MAG: ribose-phosphate diphosphokinase [Proteobacteria bacterium]|nr:ribose-phosphate diphosphokinase [Pseudomonadota bacterium]
MTTHGVDIRLLAGNANPAFAKAVSQHLGMPLADAMISRFSDGEIRVEINENMRGMDVFVLQPTCPPVNENLTELLIMIDALRRASAMRITAVVPYFGYARQDRKSHSRSPITARLIADMLEVAGADRLLCMDLHAGQIQGFFHIPVDNLYAEPLLMADVKAKYAHEELVVVSPDVGGVVRARASAKRLDVPLAIIDKRRSGPNVAEVMNVIGDVRGKTCIILDDMIDTAGTVCKAADALVQQQGAKRVVAYASHGLFSGSAIERIENAAIEEIVVTDTIPQTHGCGKIRIVSAAPLMAEAIKRVAGEESLSSLFA